METDAKAYPLTPLSFAKASNTALDGLPGPGHLHPRRPTSRSRSRPRLARLSSTLRDVWSSFKLRIGASTTLDPLAYSTSVAPDHDRDLEPGLDPTSDAARVAALAALPDDSAVDYVVVDRDWSDSWAPSEHPHSSPEKSQEKTPPRPSNDDAVSIDYVYHFGYHIWGLISHFFFFDNDFDEHTERAYQREAWSNHKFMGFVCSFYLIANWAVGGIIPRPLQSAELVFYYGFGPTFSLTLPFMIAYDWPRRFPIFYQVWLAISVWSWCLYQVLFINLCGFYGNRGSDPILDCVDKDFLGLLYYACALPTIALLALRHHRLSAAISAACFIVVVSILVTPLKKTWVRSTINFAAYYSVLLYMHYKREVIERRLYLLREELKAQMLATQQAQQSERRASESKRRLTSYIFHEVRVPLNTALLAVQNMEATNNIDRGQEIEFTALQASLIMMSKVLNDVLDFNRMDAGRFESVAAPYLFHTAMQSMFVPLKLAAEARRLQLVVELDRNVDIAARRALYEARGIDPDAISARLCSEPDSQEDAFVVGDEMRLRQVVTNLASNASKFTPEDAAITTSASQGYPNCVIVRIEVRDTGPGIRPRDLQDHKLFSPYVQTDIGKHQGGKGSGLGLALVRHIVKLSGGRLGVQSRVGMGSCFWVELPLGVGSRVLALGAGASPQCDLDCGTRSKSVEFVDPPRVMGFRMPEGEGVTPSSIRTGDKSLLSMSASTTTGDGSPSLSQSISGQAASAYRTIMDQGGRVELLLGRGDDDGQLSRAMEDSLLAQSASGGTFAAHSITSPSLSALPAPPRRSLTPSPSENGSSQLAASTVASGRAQRPTFVSIPARGSFSSISNVIAASAQHSPAPSIGLPPTLHARNGSTASVGTGERPESLGQYAGLRVLVVDDDIMTRMLMSRMLTRLGCTVQTADNGQAALDLLFAPLPTPSTGSTGSHGSALMMGFGGGGSAPGTPATEDPSHAPRFHIVFLDNQMPILSGLEVIARLREVGRTDLVVGVTGNALLSDQQEYLEAGVDHLLTKPVKENSLREKLTVAVQRARSTVSASGRPPG